MLLLVFVDHKKKSGKGAKKVDKVIRSKKKLKKKPNVNHIEIQTKISIPENFYSIINLIKYNPKNIIISLINSIKYDPGFIYHQYNLIIIHKISLEIFQYGKVTYNKSITACHM